MMPGIVSEIILFALFWNERITIKSLTFAVLCTCGVILVIQPEFIFINTDHMELNYTLNESLETTNETIAKMESNHGNTMLVAIGY